jgi:murein DD-endopeptidase MepM/ murein hydrolase activator NlpD
MAFTTTRDMRAHRWRTLRGLVAATVAVSTLQVFCATGSIAQVKAPNKSQLRAPKPTPHDSQADQLNAKWLSEHNQQEQAAPAATPPAAAAAVPPAQVQAARPDPNAAAPVAAAAPGPDDERSTVPNSAAPIGVGARTVVAGSVKLMRVASPEAAFKSLPGGANQPILKDLTQAFSGFAPAASKFEMFQGRTADGQIRLLYASLGEGTSKQGYWWFAPPDQPEGWFNNEGKRLGGTAFAEPKPDSRISSPFGRRRYYGRAGGGFHNGIDYEGKTGEPIYAAADGVINHQGLYFNYGRTVKISHADNLETLYAHMSRFEASVGPGSHVRKGDVIGYVGSTGRSTGPHLHFSTIVNGVFVDPAPYVSEGTMNSALNAGTLVAFRQWQQEVRDAAPGKRADANSRDRYRDNGQGGEGWSRNPFSATNPDRL